MVVAAAYDSAYACPLKVRILNTDLPAEDTNLFEPIQFTGMPLTSGILEIWFVAEVAGTLSLVRTNGSATVTEALGVATAGKALPVNVPIIAGDIVTLQYSNTGGKLLNLTVSDVTPINVRVK